MKSLPKNHIHLDFLDGIRGLSALYVVFFHIIADGKGELTKESLVLNLFRFGHEAVVVFIVLSGLVLALPVARSSELKLSGGLRNFFVRRAKRILPGYYAALFLVPLYILAVEISKRFIGEATDWVRIKELFLSGDMISHLLLLQNISAKWEGSMNPVLWSMATEWWIYFLFALILIPCWRRGGIFFASSVGFVLGVIPASLLLLGLPSIYGSPHLLMAFCLGMVAAALLYSQKLKEHLQLWRTGSSVLIFLALLILCVLLIYVPAIRLNSKTQFITDFLVSVLCAGVIFKLSFAEISGGRISKLTMLMKRFFEIRPIKKLGEFSYSIYLTHLAMLNIAGTTLNLSPIKARISFSLEPVPIRLFVLIPFLLLCAYGFYYLFERPFLHHRL